MRTQEEIVARFKELCDPEKGHYDIFGFQKGDLVTFMDYEHAKPFLKEEAIAKFEAGEKKWTPATDPKKAIMEYIPFAYEKARNQRGLSAMRSMDHFRTWIWLDGNEELYAELDGQFNNYTNYGLAIIDRIAEAYGFKEN